MRVRATSLPTIAYTSSAYYDLGMRRVEIKCPKKDCPTMLQPTPTGTLADGVEGHLKVVHGLPGDRARGIAVQYLTGKPAGD